jgi:biopolymer transport protein ExbD
MIISRNNDALGPEISVQVEWGADATYPEAGLFVKLDKPDDFKPTITAIIESVRKAYATSAVIKEMNSNGRNFAALEFVQSSPISPTITEDGPYLGVFLTENQAVRSFQRDPTIGLLHNADFNRQTADKLKRATQVFFLDSPRLLDHAYRTVMPYLSIASMFNKKLAAMLKGVDLPADLTWLAPMGTWSCVTTPDEEGVQGYSVSGIGNQGILLAGAMGGSAGFMQTMGLLPKPPNIPGTTYISGTTAVSSPPTPPSVQPNSTGNTNASPVLPDAANTASNAIIYITSENAIFFDSTSVPPDQFSDFLKSKKAANQDLKLTVKVDKDASPDVLSTVMDAGASAGFGVLPYTYTSGTASSPPAINSNAAAAPPLVDSATNAAPITNSNLDATPIAPGPPQPQ